MPDSPESAPENIADHVSDQQAERRSHTNASADVDEGSDPELQAALRASLADTERETASQGVRLGLQTPARRHTRRSDEEALDRNRLRRGNSPPPRRRRGRGSYADSPAAEDTDDTDELLAERVHRSPFLNPIATSLIDDVEDLESEPEITQVSHAPSAIVVDDSDDQDEQLQAVLAASLGKPCQLSSDTMAKLQRQEQPEPEPAPAPVPSDVQRIQAIRERARATQNKPEPHKEPEPEPESEPESEPQEAPQSGDSDSDIPEAPSAEEVRKRRLARFG